MKETMSFDNMMDLMRENFEYMQDSPLVRSLRKENRRLTKENKLLMSIIKDFHVSKAEVFEKRPVVIDLSNDEDEEIPMVKIKIEKTEKTDENIVYELIEKEESTKKLVPVPQEEEVEEEEEEEEVEEEEEEEEEEEVEEEKEEGRDLKGTVGSLEEEEGRDLKGTVGSLEEEEGRDLKGTVGSLEEETEVYEVTIRGAKYFTTDQKNGVIYAMDSDGDVGDEIGSFVNGVAKI